MDVSKTSKRKPAHKESPDSDFFYDVKYPMGKNSMPRFVGAVGTFKRFVIIRLRPGTDLFGGVREACKVYGILNGVIFCVFGSLQQCALFDIRPNPEPKMRSSPDMIRIPGPIEFSSAQGTISELDDGGIFVHIHGVVADRHNRVFAGHFVEGENFVLANLEVAIAEIEGVKMGRAFEPELGGELLAPTERKKNARRR
jgi:hypothetical protein